MNLMKMFGVLGFATCAGLANADPIDLGGREGATDLPYSCEETSATTIISVVLCPAGLQDEQFAKVGEAACGTVLPCGVWFWEDVSNMPQDAPENHDGLTPDEITTSRGVWIAENAAFMSIEAVIGN